jgi:GAF domain-containing protein
MATTPRQKRVRIVDLQQQLDELNTRRLRDRRSLEALHSVSLACRQLLSIRAIFDAISRELRAVFHFDACFIGLRDKQQPNVLRYTYQYDEGLIDYVENSYFGPVTATVLDTGQAILIGDLVAAQPAQEVPKSMFGNTSKHTRTWMGVPLQISNDTIGIVSVQSYTPFIYDEEDLDLLVRIAQIMTIAVENVDLNQHQRNLSRQLAERVAARSSELAAFSEIAAEMVANQPLPELLDRVLEIILPLFGAQGGIVRRYNRETNTLELLVKRGLPDDDPRIANVIQLHGSRIGKVVLENRPLVITDSTEIDQRSSLPTLFRSLLAVPLRIGNQIIGTLSIVDTNPREFQQQQTDMVEAIGNQIAIAIENARLLGERERQIQELWALSIITEAASTAQDHPTLLHQVHEALVRFMKVDAFLMFVYDPQREVIAEGIGLDEGEPYVYFRNQPPPTGSFTSWVIRNRRKLFLHNIQNDIGNYPELQQIIMGVQRPAVSWLGVPLFDRDERVIGMIAVQHYQEHLFSEHDDLFLENVARQVALHVQNVSLLTQRERQIRELDAIGRIGQIASATFDLNTMLRQAYATLQDVTASSSFFMIICDPQTGRVTNAYHIDDGSEVPVTWIGDQVPDTSLSAWIMRQREPLLFHDLPNQATDLQRRNIEPVVYGSPAVPRSWAGVPLLARNAEPIGVLAVQNSDPHQYDAQTLDFLAQVASHMSLGIQKIHLFTAEQAARRTAETLREAARVLSTSFRTDEVLQLILSELHKIVAYDSASIMLVEQRRLRMIAWLDSDGQPLAVTEPFGTDGNSGAAQVAQTREPLLIQNTAEYPGWESRSTTTVVRSWLGVPLIARDTVIGVLNVDSNRPCAFSETELTVVAAFAGQAALAIDNAQLYEDSVERVENELRFAATIQRNLFPRSLPTLPNYQLAARCIPARETGGDFYDVLVSDEDDQLGADFLGLLIGDASGKSLPGAMLMAIARSIARSEALDHREPERVMRETNHLVSIDVPQRAFVALCYARIDLERRKCAFANAGQMTPLLCRRGEPLTYLDVPAPTFPLGISDHVPYASREIDLLPGDLLIFYTDGIVEAQNASHELFGFPRLEALLSDVEQLTPEALIDHVFVAVDQFCAGNQQHDDMTMVVLRVE